MKCFYLKENGHVNEKMVFKFVLLFLIIFFGFKNSVDCNDEVKFLIQNFFDNLQEEYKNVINVEASENLKMIIDGRVDDFLTTVYQNQEFERKDRPKRDLNKLLNIENDDGKLKDFYSKLNKYFLI